VNPILLLILAIILAAALPWWPYSAYGRSRRHRPSSDDFKATEISAKSVAATKLEATQTAAIEETQLKQDYEALRRQFEACWVAGTTNNELASTQAAMPDNIMSVNRPAFFAELDRLTGREIKARLSSWNKEQLVLVREYVEQRPPLLSAFSVNIARRFPGCRRGGLGGC
jgi:hypothetical protein